MTKSSKHIVLLEPFYSGSHKQWADGLKQHSSHRIQILSLPGRHWKWRMHGGAISLAKQFNELDETPDVIVATSMLDVTTFLALTRDKSNGIPVMLYFHENQLTYPWSPQDRDIKHKRDNHYAFINYTSALAADRVYFNSEYHRNSFLEALPKFLNQFPDKQEKQNIEQLREKSEVLFLGMELSRFEEYRDEGKNEVPVLLWNHRWEYDKSPEEFFATLFRIKEQGIDFKLVVLGERNEMIPRIFEEAKVRLEDEILHWGFTESFKDYAEWLWKADFLPVTSQQDFFGGSVVEALFCNCIPILPNRLAYPEHVPGNEHWLYEEGNYEEALIQKLREFPILEKNTPQSLVYRYDWGSLINEYEKKLIG